MMKLLVVQIAARIALAADTGSVQEGSSCVGDEKRPAESEKGTIWRLAFHRGLTDVWAWPVKGN